MNPQIVIRSETAADAVDGRVIGHTGDAVQRA